MISDDREFVRPSIPDFAEGEHGGVVVHNPHYDFNDEALPWGATYWSRLVETALVRA